MKIIFGFGLVLFSVFSSSAQLMESYYSDAEQKEGGRVFHHVKYNNSIIIGTMTFDSAKLQPALIRLDTLGNTIWNTALLDTSNYTLTHVFIDKILLGMEGFLYAYCRDYGSTIKQIWKVNPVNGSIIWKRGFQYTYTSSAPRHIIDYDSTKFIVTYGNTSDLDVKLAFVNKTTGDTLSTWSLGPMDGQDRRYGICLDNLKNIYYSKGDSVFKVKGTYPDSVLWRAQYPSVLASAYHHLYFDQSTNSLFAFGKRNTGINYGRIVKVNPATGAFISYYSAATGDVEYRDMKVQGGFIYVTWRHIYVGGGNKRFWVTKYNMSTAVVPWDIAYNFIGVGSLDTHSGLQQSALSMDLDVSGNVYLTGYYGDANYGPESWGILKLNGTNGSALYEKTITEDSTNYCNLSQGVATCVINNIPCFVGDLETYFPNYYERQKITFVRLNPTTGQPVIKKYVEGRYQFPSKTLEILNYNLNQTLVLKQVGRNLKLEMYDAAQNLNWTKVLAKEYYLLGGPVSYAPNGDIFVSASSRLVADPYPYYSINTDSMFVFQINSTGSIIKEYQFFAGMPNAFPVEIHADNASALLIYQKSNVIYYRKISSLLLSSEYNSLVTYTSTGFKTNYVINESQSKSLIFGYKSGATRMIELNKTSMSTLNLSLIPNALYNIYSILRIDTNYVLISGSNNLNRETVGLYNRTLMDTVWTRQLSTNSGSKTVKCATNPSKTFLYAIGNSANDVSIRKLQVSNGQLIWSYTYNGTANLNDFPLDMTYDSFRNQIVVTGFESFGATKRVLILLMDSVGNAIDTIIKTGDFPGDNSGLCSQVLSNGSQWIGGYRNKNPFGLAGFIFGLTGPYIVTGENAEHTNSCKIIFSPNPFSTSSSINLSSCLQGKDITIQLFNLMGEEVKRIKTHVNENFTLERGGLVSGTYLYRINESDQVIYSGRFLVFD